MKLPTINAVYRHRKHDPNNGKWHEYEVVELVEPWPEDPSINRYRTHWIFCNKYRHAKTRRIYTLTGCGNRIFADVAELHIAYKNIQPDKCDPDWVFCLRPFTEFVDGRFTLIKESSYE